jgi:hypothetical protein
MAVSTRLDGYLALERIMLELDEANDPIAEQIRDAMDPLWHSLAEDERAYLDHRIVEVRSLHPVRLSLSDELYVDLTRPSAPLTLVVAVDGVGMHFTNWKLAV